MLRSILHDAAVAAAKSRSHDKVEPRHVWFAVARQLRDRPECEAYYHAARNALEPRGSSHEQPKVTAEAAQLLDSFRDEDQLPAALAEHFSNPGASTTGSASSPTAVADPEAAPVAVGAEASVPVESLEAILAELDGLVGLATVKRQVRQVMAVVEANARRAEAGLPVVAQGLHLVFTGPPGTGKTTVARLVARLYGAIGALPGANFAEVSRSELVAGYVGQTALKTTEVINRVRPGVLFIDEAYALAPSHGSDFGAEAIATLVKAMEDHRDSFVVIVAGYGEEMETFVGSNPGLRSRFKTYIDFPGYSLDELLSIFQTLADKHHLALAEGATDKVREAIGRSERRQDFGNARFVRFLFEEAYARMSARAAADGQIELAELTHLLPEDIVSVGPSEPDEGRRIGFV